MNEISSTVTGSTHVSLLPVDNQRLASLCGRCDEHLRQIETFFTVNISNRGNEFQITGQQQAANNARNALEKLYEETKCAKPLTPVQINLVLQELSAHTFDYATSKTATKFTVKTPLGIVKPRGQHQMDYVKRIRQHPINFGIGPAGTGKTFLAVACAVEALEKGLVRRMVLVRPAVEAGEKLGFLPGDFAQKVDPYLRPIYDALYETMGIEQVNRHIEKNVIEIAPLAYMRGRTLNDAFIILDEAQNTTPEQMKMFLTRIGFGSTAVVTGDITQNDLPKGKTSGLHHAIEVLNDIKDICFTFFQAKDVVRHPLVQSIVQAYAKGDDST